MADAPRTTEDYLTDLTALEEEPYRFDFYHALRLIEALHKDRPRLGTSRRPSDDPVRLSQETDLAFETSSLSAFTPGEDGRPHQLVVRMLGLLGPNGPLPLHLTEYVRDRGRQKKDHTFAAFLNIFHHRMLSLFYRAWANSEPAVSYDRPESDRFGQYIGALAGLVGAAAQKGRGIAEHSKLYYCGWLSGPTKCAEGLEALLADYFNITVRVEECVGEWLRLSQSHRCRPGLNPASAVLGRSAYLGEKVFSREHKFRLHLGPLSLADYHRFLPVGDRINRLVMLVRNYIGDELAWDVRLILQQKEIPMARLDGRSRLGWTTWLGDPPKPEDSTELILDAHEWVIG